MVAPWIAFVRWQVKFRFRRFCTTSICRPWSTPVAVGGDAGPDRDFQRRPHRVATGVARPAGPIGEVGGRARPHDPRETVPVERIVALVELLHGLQKTVVPARGAQHDETAPAEHRVD